MKIHIKSVTGEEIPMEIGISDTLSDLKQKIFDSKGIVPDDLRFLLGNTRLIDNEVVVVDQVNAILANQPHLLDSIENDQTANVTVWMVLPLGGGIAAAQRVESRSISSSKSDFDDGERSEDSSHRVLIQSGPDQSSHCDELPQIGEQKKPFILSAKRLQIHVKTLTGRTFTVEIAPLDTLDVLKQKIFDEEGLEPHRQRLIVLGRRQLEGDGTFSDILASHPEWVDSVEREPMPGGPDIKTVHVTIHLVFRTRGGGNIIFHEVKMQSSSSDSDCNDDNPRDGKQKNFFKLSGGRILQIHIKTIYNKEVPIEIAVSDTVHDVKQKIFHEEGIEPDKQVLIFEDSWLLINDDNFLSQANVYLAHKWTDSVESKPMPGGPDIRIVHATIKIFLCSRGGGNTISQGVQKQSSSSDSDCNDQNPRNGGRNTVSHEVQGQSSLPPMPESSNRNKHPRNGEKKENFSGCGCFSLFGCR